MTVPRIIVVDDDKAVRTALGQSLELADFRVTLCSSFIEATDHISRTLEGAILSDIRMPGKDGFDLLERVGSIDRDLPVILLTGHGDIPMAVDAMTRGAFDFLEKPCSSSKVVDVVSRATAQRRLVLENRRLRAAETIVNIAGEAGSAGTLAQRMDMVERLLIAKALKEAHGHVINTADALGLPRKTLYDKMKRHGLSASDYRGDD
jgi:two-component system C4-dicarboxylate transport response regulator DctD